MDKLGAVERSLDPASEAEWAELRELGHRMLDGMFDYVRGLGNEPAWQELPKATREAFESAAIPRTGVGTEVAYTSFMRDVLPYGSAMRTHGSGVGCRVMARLLECWRRCWLQE